jgi:hypothetical protein
VGFQALQDTTSGNDNTALGQLALFSNLTGSGLTAVGSNALILNNGGAQNGAFGFNALAGNTNGNNNHAFGYQALQTNSTGNDNCAFGLNALGLLLSGNSNVAFGNGALGNINSGSTNIAIGLNAGTSYTTTEAGNILLDNAGVIAENNTIRIGTAQTRAFVLGIRGIATGIADAIPVLIDSGNQLGTASSKRELKENIKDVEDVKDIVANLIPRRFNFKSDESKKSTYGFIADETDQVCPDIVVHDPDGTPQTIQYHLLPIILTKEIQRLQKVVDYLLEKIENK